MVQSQDKIFVWLITNGSDMYDRELTRVVFNTKENRPKAVEMLNFLLDLQYGSKVSMPFEAGRDTTALFTQGKAAIIEGGNWNLPRYKETLPDLDMDIIMYPAGPSGSKPTTHTWTNMQVLPAKTKNPDVAWSFLEFHSSTKSLVQRMVIMGVNGPPLDMYKTPEWADIVKKIPAYARYPDVIIAGRYLDYRRYKEVEKAILPFFQAVMLQKQKPEEILGPAETAANEVLASPA